MALFGRKKNQPAAPVVEEAPVETLPGAPAPREDGLRSMSAHRDYVLSLIEPLPSFGMKVLDAVGLPLTENLTAVQDIPNADSALVEGYAVRADDVAAATDDKPVVLPLAGTIGIGEMATGAVEPGECVRLVAGAPMPAGTDAVVPLASGIEADGDVSITVPVHRNANMRARGGDIADGDVLLRQGELLGPRTVGLLAAAGIDRVMARPRPRVVVLATGGELVEPGHTLGRDSDTYDANSYLLAASARALGAEVYRVCAYTTDREAIKGAISDQMIRADLIISTGGVSRDDYDLVKSVLPELGLTDFCEVAMSPGSSQGIGLIGPDKIPMVMLPGNPISAYVSFQVFVRPAIRALMGLEPAVEKLARGVTRQVVRGVSGKVTWVRGVAEEQADGRLLVEPILESGAGAHLLRDLARANCLIHVDEVTDAVPAGERVDLLLLGAE